MMKQILFLLASCAAISQNVVVDHIDAETKTHTVRVNCSYEKRWFPQDNIAKNFFTTMFLSCIGKKTEDSISYELILDVTGNNSICVSDKNGKLAIHFTDGSNSELKQISGDYCDNGLTIKYQVDPYTLSQLSSNEVETIVIHADYPVEVKIKPIKRRFLQKTFVKVQEMIN